MNNQSNDRGQSNITCNKGLPLNLPIMLLFLLVMTMMLLMIPIESRFLAIKLPKETSFVPVASYEIASFMLKSSLTDIVMDGIEVIISDFIQVKNSREIMRVDRNYPQWKIIRLLYKEIYEGIRLSKRENHIIIHSLSIEATDPIPFSVSTKWSMQLEEKDNSVVIFGSSLELLYRIAKALFRRKVDIKAFKNFNLYVNQIYSYYLKDKKFDIDLLGSHQLEHLFYMETLEDDSRALHFTKELPRTIPNIKKNRKCHVNSKVFDNLAKASRFIEKELKISNSLDIYNVPRTDEAVKSSLNSRTVEFSTKNIEGFSEKLKTIIEKLYFSLFTIVPIFISFNNKDQRITIIFITEVFLLSLLNEVENIIGMKIDDPDTGMFGSTIEVVKDLKDRSIRFPDMMNESLVRGIASPSSFGSVKKVWKFWNKFSYETTMRQIIVLEREMPELELGKLREIFNVFIDTFAKMGMGMEMEIGAIETIFDHKDKKAIIKCFNLKSPNIGISKIVGSLLSVPGQWKFSVININRGLKVQEITTNYRNVPLYLWKYFNLDQNLFMSIKRFSSKISAHSRQKVIEVKRLNEDTGKRIVKLLLSDSSIYEVYEIRLKPQFSIEIDLVQSSFAEEFINFLSRTIGTPITYTLSTESKLKNITMNTDFGNFEYKHSLNKLLIRGGLNLEEAQRLLFERPLSDTMSPIVQVMEIKENYLFSGHLKVIYYIKMTELENYTKKNLLNYDEIVRMGKSANYTLSNGFSFLFFQYSSNETDKYAVTCNHEEKLNVVVCSFDLHFVERISEIFVAIHKLANVRLRHINMKR